MRVPKNIFKEPDIPTVIKGPRGNTPRYTGPISRGMGGAFGAYDAISMLVWSWAYLKNPYYWDGPPAGCSMSLQGHVDCMA
jgi:hypothetical protein